MLAGAIMYKAITRKHLEVRIDLLQSRAVAAVSVDAAHHPDESHMAQWITCDG